MGCGSSVPVQTNRAPTKRNDNQLHFYSVHEELGSGHFAKVVKVTDTRNGESYAMKIIDKKEMIKSQTEVKEEIQILQTVGKHPNIVHLECFFEDAKNYYLVMELCTGGDVFSRIIESGHFSEKEAIRCCRELASALALIHSKGITHRDLKPENILLTSKDPGATIKVCDFGLSKLLKGQTKMKTICGTWAYCAPEVISNKDYTRAVDCWTMGVLMYILLSGYHPFDVYGDLPEPQLLTKIINVQYDFDDPVWEEVSDECKILITQLLQHDPKTRMSMDDYLKSGWINSIGTTTHKAETFRRLREGNLSRKSGYVKSAPNRE